MSIRTYSPFVFYIYPKPTFEIPFSLILFYQDRIFRRYRVASSAVIWTFSGVNASNFSTFLIILSFDFFGITVNISLTFFIACHHT